MEIATTCRTCMTSKEGGLVDLFQPLKLEDSLESSLELAQALMECTATQVSKDDGLPQKLCEDCVKLLYTCYTFRSQAQNAEAEFKQLIQLQAEIKEEKPELKPETEFNLNFDDIDSFEPYDDAFNVEVPKPEDVEKQEHEDRLYQCSKCNKQYSKEKKFLKHLSSHEKNLTCNICDKSFRRQIYYDKHMKKHKNEHKCSICSHNFECEQVLLDHIKSHAESVEVKTEQEGIKQFKCEICCMPFASKHSLAMHRKKHKIKTKKPIICLICDYCNKEFHTKSLLKRHLKIHSDVRPYQCPRCSKSYTRQDQLDQHLNIHKGLKPNICPYCNKGFSQLCSLKDHVRTHTRETPYLCSQCGKSFSNSSNLRQHMMRHSGLKPYACSLCPKTFSTKGQMTCHTATHTGAHPFSCECGARFTKPNSLKKHQLIHLDLRPYRCDDCPMTFRCKDHLKRHYRIHTGEKPYKCQYCERAFTQSNDLVKHTRSHVGQNVYQCTVCDLRFRLLSELKQHYPTHYIDGEPPTVPIGRDSKAPILAPLKDPPNEAHYDTPPLVKKPNSITQEEIPAIDDKQEPERIITISFNRNILDKAIDGIGLNLST